jgi:hypothetical protein
MRSSEHYRRREIARNQQELQGTFVPALRMNRHLSPADFDMADAQEAIFDALQERFPQSAYKYRVNTDEQLHLTVIEQGDLMNRFKAAGVCPSGQSMREIATDMRDGLGELIAADCDPVTLPVGQLTLLGRKQNKLGMYVGPRSWRSAERRYARNFSGQRTPFGVIVDEINFCKDVLEEHLCGRYKRFSTEGMYMPNHVTLMEKVTGTIYEREAQQLTMMIREILPRTVTFDDPIIRFRTGRRDDEKFTMPVIEPSERVAQLAGSMVVSQLALAA